MVRKCGFTLLELVIVIAITGTLASITFVGFREQTKVNAVKAAAREIAATIRQAEAFTRSGVPKGLAFPKGGYGVQIDSTNKRYRMVWSSDGADNYSARTATEAPWQALPRNVIFNPAPTNALIVFLPPKVVMARKTTGGAWLCAVTPYRAKWCSDASCSATIPNCTVNLNQSDVTIRVKHAQVNVFQTIVIQPLSGKVSVE